jgi:uncharacterized membrane protein YhhN
MAKVQRFHPPVNRAVAWWSALQFLVLLQGVALVLWHSHRLPPSQSAVWVALLATGLWAVGALLQGRITLLETLLVDAGAIATATAATGWVEWHQVFKPLAMLLAVAAVAARMRLLAAPARFSGLLIAALVLSLAGDCLLMFPGLFIPGLVAFLTAHLCYIALFRQGLPWLPSRRALFATIVCGAAMYAFLFNALSPVLRIAVGAYVVVIALMAAQAIGRALILRDRQSAFVAGGAALFMLSDSLLATNKFAFAVPMAPLWILATYYLAQIMIACNARPVHQGAAAGAVHDAPLRMPAPG